MLSHVSLGVSDLSRARTFYDAVLGALGFVRVVEYEHVIGYGFPGGPDKLALFAERDAVDRLAAGPGFHLAFQAPDRSAVDRFHAAAMETGGRSDGPPGPRPRYSPTYYAAFVFDPDGHRLEAVHH